MIAHSGPQNPGTLFPVWCSLATRDPGTSLLIQAIRDSAPLSFQEQRPHQQPQHQIFT